MTQDTVHAEPSDSPSYHLVTDGLYDWKQTRRLRWQQGMGGPWIEAEAKPAMQLRDGGKGRTYWLLQESTPTAPAQTEALRRASLGKEVEQR